jgi:hypothetical protein
LVLSIAVTGVVTFLGAVGAAAAVVFGLLLVGWVIGEVVPEGLEEALVFVGVGVVVVGGAASDTASIFDCPTATKEQEVGRDLTSCAGS